MVQTWTVTSAQEWKLDTVEMKITDGWKMDKVRNEVIRETTKLMETSKKLHRRLKWYGHVRGREEDHPI